MSEAVKDDQFDQFRCNLDNVAADYVSSLGSCMNPL